MDRFEMLRQRFEARAKLIEKVASKWRERCLYDTAELLESKALIYQRCADELARVLAGETPPAPGEAWETKEKPE